MSKSVKFNSVYTLPYILYTAHYWVWAPMCPVCAGSPSNSGDREKRSERGQTSQKQTSRDIKTSQNEFTRLQLVLNHYITVCWVMECVFLTNRFSISLTSSLTWLRIFLQHSALCWILPFSVRSSGERQEKNKGEENTAFTAEPKLKP